MMLGRLLCIVKLTDGDYNVNVSIIGIMLYEEEFSCRRETESIKNFDILNTGKTRKANRFLSLSELFQSEQLGS